MIYSIVFRYRAPEDLRPEREAQDQEINFEGIETVAIPNVGDAVTYQYDGRNVMRMVESRTFNYSVPPEGQSYCHISIVVTDLSSEEIAARH